MAKEIIKATKAAKLIMEHKGVRNVDLARKMKMTPAATSGRLALDSISVAKLNDVLFQLDYEIVLRPIGRGEGPEFVVE